MPDSYNGSPQSVEQLKQNIARSGIVGSLVANDFKSSMIFVPLLDKEPGTGKRIDYQGLSKVLEEKIRAKYELAQNLEQVRAKAETPQIKVHVIGFAKLIGELIDGLLKVMTFFAVAALIATAIIYAYTRCVRSTALVIACSLVAVVWQLGLVALFGFELDPFSILVPFLVFAIGVSHGAQKMNGIMQDIGRGTHKLVAARYTFRRLFLAGLTALLADAVGFAVLMVIDIPVIRDLALTASIGVAVLIFTNLLLLPVLLSYTGVSASAAERSLRAEKEETPRQGPRRRCGRSSTASPRATGRSARSRCRVAAGGGGLRRLPAAQDRRPRSGRAGAAAEFALQPGQRLHHRALRAVLGPVRADREDAARKAASSTRRWSTPTGWHGRCGRCRACRPRSRWPTPRGRSPPARSRATRSGSRSTATRTC